jgi:hypothetical protein
MKNKLVLFTLLALIMTRCADATPVQIWCFECHEYGFWGGLWHGIIALPDFFGSLLWKDVVMYAPNNSGHWYDAGFLIGIGAFGALVEGLSRIKLRITHVYTRE